LTGPSNKRPISFQHRRGALRAPAAIPGVEQKFFLDIGARQRLCAPPRMWGWRSSTAVPSRSVARMWPCEIPRVGILRVDPVAHLGG